MREERDERERGEGEREEWKESERGERERGEKKYSMKPCDCHHNNTILLYHLYCGYHSQISHSVKCLDSFKLLIAPTHTCTHPPTTHHPPTHHPPTHHPPTHPPAGDPPTHRVVGGWVLWWVVGTHPPNHPLLYIIHCSTMVKNKLSVI